MTSGSFEDPGDQAGDLNARLVAATERLGHAARLLLRSTASRHGLSVTQAQILLRLTSDRDSHPGTVTALTRWFDVSQPTISDAVRSLTQKGLLTRERQGRRQGLELSETGHAVARDLSSWDQPLRAAFDDQSPQRRGELLSTMLHTIATLHREGVVTVLRSCTTCRFFRPAPPTASTATHHCALLDAPLQMTDLRLDCPEHQPSDATP